MKISVIKRIAMLLALCMVLGMASCKEDTKNKLEAAGEAVADEAAEATDKAAEAVQEVAADASSEVREAIDGIRSERISFDAGASSARIEGSITGDEIVDYKLHVEAGQYMNISMATQNTACYFNVMEPGEKEVAVFNGSVGENQFEGQASESGDYTIRVYMMRSAARRGEVAPYTLEAVVADPQ